VILRRFMKDVVLPVAVAIALAILIQGVIAKPYQIPTESMVPTIQAGDRVIANRVIYKFRDIDRGDIIVFEPTLEARKSCAQTAEEIASNIPFVKRVIGVAGDHIEIRAGQREVLVNGKPFDVPKAQPNPIQGPTGQDAVATFDVPKGKIFVLGDNRQNSCDSHQWSDPFVPTGNVIGQAEVTYWPLRHIKFLN
jgi:signal peptidase I